MLVPISKGLKHLNTVIYQFYSKTPVFTSDLAALELHGNLDVGIPQSLLGWASWPMFLPTENSKPPLS